MQGNFLLALLKQAENQISAGLKYDIGSGGVAGNLKNISFQNSENIGIIFLMQVK